MALTILLLALRFFGAHLFKNISVSLLNLEGRPHFFAMPALLACDVVLMVLALESGDIVAC